MTFLISSTEAADYLQTLIPHARRSQQRPGPLTISPPVDLPEGHWCFEADDLSQEEACALIVQVWRRCPPCGESYAEAA